MQWGSARQGAGLIPCIHTSRASCTVHRCEKWQSRSLCIRHALHSNMCALQQRTMSLLCMQIDRDPNMQLDSSVQWLRQNMFKEASRAKKRYGVSRACLAGIRKRCLHGWHTVGITDDMASLCALCIKWELIGVTSLSCVACVELRSMQALRAASPTAHTAVFSMTNTCTKLMSVLEVC